MYSRPSTRKHKKWEGDGFIVCRHSTESVLYSESGKELTRLDERILLQSTGTQREKDRERECDLPCPFRCLLNARRFGDLREGEDVMFGSMEIQIQDLLEDVPPGERNTYLGKHRNVLDVVDRWRNFPISEPLSVLQSILGASECLGEGLIGGGSSEVRPSLSAPFPSQSSVRSPLVPVKRPSFQPHLPPVTKVRIIRVTNVTIIRKE